MMETCDLPQARILSTSLLLLSEWCIYSSPSLTSKPSFLKALNTMLPRSSCLCLCSGHFISKTLWNMSPYVQLCTTISSFLMFPWWPVWWSKNTFMFKSKFSQFEFNRSWITIKIFETTHSVPIILTKTVFFCVFLLPCFCRCII